MVDNPRAASALASVPEPDRTKVVTQAASSGKPVTARAIKESHDKIKSQFSNRGADAGADKADLILDETGYEVPSDITDLWQRAPEVQGLLTAITKVKSVVAHALKESDPLYKEVTQTLISDLTNSYNGLMRAKPYAVCPTCSGRKTISKNCRQCRGRGIVSKFMWDTTVTKQDKQMREAIVAKRKA